MRVRLILVSALLLTGGCTSLRTEIGKPVDPACLETPTVSTHYREILKAMGPPTRMSTAGTDLVFLYEYALLKENQFGFSSPAEWLRFFKLSAGKATALRKAALLVFNEQGTLKAHGFREWKEDLGSGGSVQLLVSVMNVVDTSSFEEETYQHLWGGRLLESDLAVALNRPNSLEGGKEGLELLATPEWAGQHTLQH
jgi:hypothetical protein